MYTVTRTKRKHDIVFNISLHTEAWHYTDLLQGYIFMDKVYLHTLSGTIDSYFNTEFICFTVSYLNKYIHKKDKLTKIITYTYK